MLNSTPNILILVSSITTLAMAIVIFLAAKKNLANWFLALAILASGLWGLSLLITILSANLITARLSFASASFIPVSLFMFMQLFQEKHYQIKKIIYSILPALIFAAISMTSNMLFKSIVVTSEGYIKINQSGPLLIPFGLYFGIYTVALTYLLIKSYRNSAGTKRAQIRILIAGLLISVGFGALLNLSLPLLGIYKYNNMGPVFTLFLSISIMYTATQHHLFETKVIASEIWAFFLTLTALIWFLANISTINGFVFVMVVVMSILFIRSILSETQKNEEIKKQNGLLEKDKKQLIELDRMKDEFLQMATHELNTPITVIQGKLDMAINENLCHLDQEQKKFLEPVLTDTERLAHLSKDILNTARIDQHRLKINASETDINALISQIVSGFEVKTKERSNSIAYIQMSKNVPKLNIDQSKIGEVITNLITNANKFTEKGKIAVTSKIKDDHLVISVADTGIGIEKEDQNHLFEKFYQAGRFDPKNPQEQQGSGLGLYISRNIIKLHGGEMWLESEKGEGSTFYFSLPLEYKEYKEPAKLHIADSEVRLL